MTITAHNNTSSVVNTHSVARSLNVSQRISFTSKDIYVVTGFLNKFKGKFKSFEFLTKNVLRDNQLSKLLLGA